MGNFMDNQSAIQKCEQNEVLQEKPNGYGNLGSFFIIYSIISACISILSKINSNVFDLSKSTNYTQTLDKLLFYNKVILFASVALLCALYIIFRFRVKRSDNSLSLKILDSYSLFFITINSLSFFLQLFVNFTNESAFLRIDSYYSYIYFNWEIIIIAFFLFFTEKNLAKKRICSVTIAYFSVYILYSLASNLSYTGYFGFYKIWAKIPKFVLESINIVVFCGGILLLGLYLKRISDKKIVNAEQEKDGFLGFKKQDVFSTGVFLLVFSVIGIAASIVLNVYGSYFNLKTEYRLFTKRDIICFAVILLALAAYYFIRKKLLSSQKKVVILNSVFCLLTVSMMSQTLIYRGFYYRQFYIVFIILSCFMFLAAGVVTKKKLFFIIPVIIVVTTFVSNLLVQKMMPQYTAHAIMNSADFLSRKRSYETTKAIVDCVLSFAGLIFLGVYFVIKSKDMTEMQIESANEPVQEDFIRAKITSDPDDKILNFLDNDNV